MTEEELKKENEALKAQIKPLEDRIHNLRIKNSSLERKNESLIKESIPENIILLLLEDILEYGDELCSVCKFYGQNLSKCKCLRNSECAKHILELFKDFQERIKIES